MEKITLYQAPTRPWKTPNLSPFCCKVETYLRMTEIPHAIAPMQRSKAPRGKIPYIDLGGGKLLADSQHIIEHFEKELGDKALDHGISNADRATGRIVRRMLEEATYFHGMYVRWVADDGYAIIKDEFKKFVPGFVLPLIRRDIKKRLHGQGTSRHSNEQIEEMAAADFDAIAELLGDKPYLFGEQPRTTDCVVYAFVEAVMGFPKDSMRRRLETRKNLVAHRERIRQRWFKDLLE